MRKIPYLLNRDGRYYARLVVPKDLRKIVGKSELREPLGPDRRAAIKLLPGQVAKMQHELAVASQKNGEPTNAPMRYPMAPDQMALSLYQQRLTLDDELRNDPRWPSVGIDDLLVQQLRVAIAGKSNDAELGALVGAQIERFRASGNLDAKPGSPEWREIARALCHAELEALARVAERDEGDFTGSPVSPVIKEAKAPEPVAQKVSLKRLWADYIESRVQAGFMRDQGKRLRPVEDSLRKFLKHDDACRVSKKDLLSWRDHLMTEKSAKTTNDIYLSGVRSLFSWAVENDRLHENVAKGVRQPKPKKIYGRERGYTDQEAVRLLRASRAYQSKADEFGYVREAEKTANMKRWVPILCAFSGARVSELTQLRKQDIRSVDGQFVVRITPDAGTVKAGGYRDVPLHPQVIDEGFADFVAASPEGPLFHSATEPEKYQRAAVIVSNKLSDWLRESGLTPEGLQPNHAWRHRLKTQCRELGISDRVVDAIQGHAGKTAGDNYGDVTLKTKTNAIKKLPKFDLN